jgi:hypothetical protein
MGTSTGSLECLSRILDESWRANAIANIYFCILVIQKSFVSGSLCLPNLFATLPKKFRISKIQNILSFQGVNYSTAMPKRPFVKRLDSQFKWNKSNLTFESILSCEYPQKCTYRQNNLVISTYKSGYELSLICRQN